MKNFLLKVFHFSGESRKEVIETWNEIKKLPRSNKY